MNSATQFSLTLSHFAGALLALLLVTLLPASRWSNADPSFSPGFCSFLAGHGL